jgi:hypothetical protein
MNPLNKLIFGLLITLFLIPALVLAQDDQCLATIQSALASTEESCGGTGRNQACFVHPGLQAVPQTGFGPFTFSQAGDIISAREIHTLRSNPLSDRTYGVSLLRIQDGLSDAAPEQNVTMLVFGDVEIRNNVDATDVPPTLEVSPTGSMNIRGGPSTEDAIVGMLDARQTVIANGRLGDNSWLRITLADGGFGWLSAPLVTTSGDINVLDMVDTSGTPIVVRYGPMQSFTFQSGIDDSPCAGAPASGILIQTPADSRNVSFSINAAEFILTGTAFVQSQPGGEMRVYTVEGVARVSSAQVTQVIPAGTLVRIPLDANWTPSGAPLEPEPYDATALYALPVGNLGREAGVAPPLTPEQITQSGIPIAGEWVTTYTILSLDCDGGRIEVEERFRSNPLTLQVEQEGAAIVLGGSHERDDPPFAPVTLIRRAAGFYMASATLENASGRQSQYEFTIYVMSPTQIEGVTVGLGGDCTTTGPFNAELVNVATGG